MTKSCNEPDECIKTGFCGVSEECAECTSNCGGLYYYLNFRESCSTYDIIDSEPECEAAYQYYQDNFDFSYTGES